MGRTCAKNEKAGEDKSNEWRVRRCEQRNSPIDGATTGKSETVTCPPALECRRGQSSGHEAAIEQPRTRRTAPKWFSDTAENELSRDLPRRYFRRSIVKMRAQWERAVSMRTKRSGPPFFRSSYGPSAVQDGGSIEKEAHVPSSEESTTALESRKRRTRLQSSDSERPVDIDDDAA